MRALHSETHHCYLRLTVRLAFIANRNLRVCIKPQADLGQRNTREDICSRVVGNGFGRIGSECSWGRMPKEFASRRLLPHGSKRRVGALPLTKCTRFAAVPLFGAAAAVAAVSPALAYCFDPSAPYCASSFSGFSDQYEFDRCKNKIESYQADVENYMSCRNREAQQGIDEASRDKQRALDTYNEAVESFNRRARR